MGKTVRNRLPIRGFIIASYIILMLIGVLGIILPFVNRLTGNDIISLLDSIKNGETRLMGMYIFELIVQILVVGVSVWILIDTIQGIINQKECKKTSLPFLSLVGVLMVDVGLVGPSFSSNSTIILLAFVYGILLFVRDTILSFKGVKSLIQLFGRVILLIAFTVFFAMHLYSTADSYPFNGGLYPYLLLDGDFSMVSYTLYVISAIGVGTTFIASLYDKIKGTAILEFITAGVLLAYIISMNLINQTMVPTPYSQYVGVMILFVISGVMLFLVVPQKETSEETINNEINEIKPEEETENDRKEN